MVEFSVEITSEQMDALESLFCEELQQNWLLFQKNKKTPPYLKGYFDDEESAKLAFAELESISGKVGVSESEIRPFEEQDWKMAYRHHLKPWQYGRLNWVPEWEKETFPLEPGNAYLYLDSGMAFGTGSHETTRLCAEALYDYLDQLGDNAVSQRIIDAGCGSGILAMSAAVLGLKEIYAFDRDPEAVRVSIENLQANDLVDTVEVIEAGLEGGLKGRTGDVILANIQADVLMIYADNIIQAFNPDGIMILSGILAEERDKVTTEFSDKLDAFFSDQTFESRWDQKGDWVSVIFEKKN